MNKAKTTIGLAFLALLTLATLAQAQTYNPGVTTGQYVKYSNFSASGFGAPADLNQTDWIKVEVTAVNGKNVTLHLTGQFKNGTAPTPMDMIVNVQTGDANSSEAFGVGGFGSFLLLAGNLSAGDNVVTSSSETLQINETTPRTILGAIRTVNIINFTMQQEAFDIEYIVVYDQASGVLLEADISESLPYYGTMHVSLSVTETNIYSTGAMGWLQDNIFYIIIAIVFIILIIVAGVALSRSRKPPTTEPPPKPTPPTST